MILSGWWAIPLVITVLAYGIAFFIDVRPYDFPALRIFLNMVATIVALSGWLIYFMVF